LTHATIHVLQHTFFFISALIFWWAVFGHRTRVVHASALALLFTTMLHTSALGLLLTFAPRAWYAHAGAAIFGLTDLEDQQLGGLIMWLPGAFAYLVAGLAVVALWLSPHTGRPLGFESSATEPDTV
jgi:cytochrome c oxidase assembly factor CtaG